LNLFYVGRLQAMPAGYTTDDGRFLVIRPLIECAEQDIERHAHASGYPIMPCNLCGSQSGLKREAMRELIDGLEAEHPNVRAVMLSALRNVHPSHLLDRRVAAAWEAFADDSEAPTEPTEISRLTAIRPR
jgi:tRNA 2-thiocytidine biosynthesis protein TtcA